MLLLLVCYIHSHTHTHACINLCSSSSSLPSSSPRSPTSSHTRPPITAAGEHLPIAAIVDTDDDLDLAFKTFKLQPLSPKENANFLA